MRIIYMTAVFKDLFDQLTAIVTAVRLSFSNELHNPIWRIHLYFFQRLFYIETNLSPSINFINLFHSSHKQINVMNYLNPINSKLLAYMLIVLFSSGMPKAQAQLGSLDPTYGDNGIFFTHLQNITPEAYCSALDSQGRLIAGGSVYLASSAARHSLLVRLLSDGSLDPTFGTGGYVIDTIEGARIYGLTIANDGKILACGRAPTNTAEFSSDFVIYRFNEDGSPDNSFSDDGRTFVDFGPLHRNRANSINEQNDGKILVTGNFHYGDEGLADLYKIGICRLLPNGDLDATYGSNGLVIQDLNLISARSYHSTIDANGKLVVAGWRRPEASDGNNHGVILRLNENGSPDPTFGEDGLAFANIPEADYIFFSLVIGDDGSIYTCGTSTDPENGEWDFIIAKFSPNGDLDTDYANGGFLNLEFTDVSEDEAHDLVLQDDGKLLVIGQVQNNSNDYTWEYAALRLNQNGSIDTSFGDNGLSHFMAGPSDSYPVTVELQSDGKALLVGFTSGNSPNNGMAVARIITSLDVGIVDLKTEQVQVLVYPNPIVDDAAFQFELTQEATVSVELFNIEGKSIQQILSTSMLNSGKHVLPIDLTNFPAGVYLLKLNTDNSETSVRLSKR